MPTIAGHEGGPNVQAPYATGTLVLLQLRLMAYVALENRSRMAIWTLRKPHCLES